MYPNARTPRRVSGLSLLEVLAVVTLLGIVALIALPRMAGRGAAAKARSCEVHQGNIEIQAQLWFRNKGDWPAADLSDIGDDKNYFVEGLPTCPVDGSSYTFDKTTQEVNGHDH